MTNFARIVVLALAVVAAACSTRINQQAGGDATLSISTSTAIQPSTAVGTNPSSSVTATRIESR
jgi:hypothetical protein